MSRNKKIAIGVIVFLIVLQFVPMTKNQGTASANDLMTTAEVPVEVGKILKTACYDCHSNNTVYPWYAGIQPVGFWLNSHVNGGKQNLNFSEWATYDAKKKAHKLEEICEEVETAHMPPKSYAMMHEGTRLTEEQAQLVCDWARGVQP